MIFSVVIPLYNKRPFIELTINSVLDQKVTDYELIIIDDGSTDGSAELAEAFLKKFRFAQIFRQRNAGVSAARNKGIELAKGEWVAFLDADDYWHPNYLAIQLESIKRFKNVHMVATNLRALPSSSNWSPFPWPTLSPSSPTEVIHDLPHRWFTGHTFITSSVVIRTSVLLSMQPCFSLGESNGEDIELWLRLYEVSDVARASQPLVAYPEAPPEGLSARITNHFDPPYLARIAKRARSLDVPAEKRAGLIFFVGQQRISLSRLHLEIGQRQKAIKLLFQAWPVMFSRRWLTSLFMTIAFPSSLAKRWNEWRYLRKAVRG